jgi:hypothetical protein
MRGAVICALAVLGVLALVVGTTAPTVASDVRVRHALFGVHDRSGASYGTVHEGSVRLWDVGVRWDLVETTRGHYDWSRLDSLVEEAQAEHTQVTMVVAMTPAFYSSDPTKPPRRIARYREFVRALMKRYHDFHGHRGIAAYQVWNEGNISAYWTGTPGQLARLTRAMWQVRNRWDPQAKVIAPPMAARRGSPRSSTRRPSRTRGSRRTSRAPTCSPRPTASPGCSGTATTTVDSPRSRAVG